MKFIKEFSVFESTPEMSADLASFLDGTDISAEIIPHENFHHHKWLIPKEGKKKWYYQMKSESILNSSTDPEFLETVDYPIRESVKHLHKNGVPTTPSCSGHFNDLSHYEKIHENLSEECEKIRDQGLAMIDPKSGEEYIVRDKEFMLPWNSRAFAEKAESHGKMGVIGIYDPDKKYLKALEESRIDRTQTMEDGDITLFITSPSTKEELIECWKNFESSVTRI